MGHRNDNPVMFSVTDRDFRAIRDHLLQPCGREHQVFGFLSRSGPRLLLRSLFIPDQEDYEDRSPVYLRMAPSYMIELMRTYGAERPDGFIDLHSHPTQSRARFSSVDAEFQAGTLYDCFDRHPEGVFLRGVFGTEDQGFSLELVQQPTVSQLDWLPDGSGDRIDEIEVIRPSGIQRLRSFRGAEAPQQTALDDYARNAVLRRPDERRRMSGAAVAVIGAGGLGSELARLLALAGVRRLVLIDDDVIERVNWNRLEWARSADVGRPKVDRLQEMLTEHDPQLDVLAIRSRFPCTESEEALEECDLVVSGVDDDRGRYEVLRWCVRHLRPAIDCGTGISLNDTRDREEERAAHVRIYWPGSRQCWMHAGLSGPALWDESLREAQRQAGYVLESEEAAFPGSVQGLNALTAAHAVQIAEQVLLGRDPGPPLTLITYGVGDRFSSDIRSAALKPDPTCPLCGTDGFEGLGGRLIAPDGRGSATETVTAGAVLNPEPHDAFTS